MRFVERVRLRRAAAIAAGALVAACGSLPGPAPEGNAAVVKVSRTAWNAEPEDGLYRVSFDERRSRQILTRAGYAQAPEGVDPYFSEIAGLEEEAGRELQAKGLCGTSAKLVAPAERAAGGGITGIFKCRPTVF
jgi:hypothetical protein